MLILLFFSKLVIIYVKNFQHTLESSIQFIGCRGLMFWLVYFSGFCLRFFIKDSELEKIGSSKRLHDTSLSPAPFLLF
jgi:hypothetical protein